ncbi:MAG: subtype B tannase [Natronospirillum sp.]
MLVLSELDFDVNVYTQGNVEVNGQTIAIRSFEGLYYVENPKSITVQHENYEPNSTDYHKVNIYIPEAYFQGQSIAGYSADTAPIHLHVGVGGWHPALPGDVNEEAIGRGYIYVSPGIRGYRVPDGEVKHPSSVVDAKAVVRYLRFNDERMPGDAENRLVLTGNSAGSGIVMATAASANQPEFLPYLDEIGAADVPDHVFAVSPSAYMSSLEYSSMAYEWQYKGEYYVDRLDRNVEVKEMEYSEHLASLFPGFVNSLHLTDSAGEPLTLDRDGNGPFKDHLVGMLKAEAQKALNAGTDMTDHDFVTVVDGQVTDFSFEGWVQDYNSRFRDRIPGFDTWDNATSSQWGFAPEGGEGAFLTYYGYAIGEVDMPMAQPLLLKMMNPMSYVDQPDVAPHWRIRQGMRDNHLGHSMPLILGLMLEGQGIDVEYDMNFNAGHGGSSWDWQVVYDWIDRIVE